MLFFRADAEYDVAYRKELSRMAAERTRAVNALTALLRTIDFGVDVRKALARSQISTIAAWRPRGEESVMRTCRGEATRLAKRIKALDVELADNRRALDTAVNDIAPELCALPGVGSVVAGLSASRLK